MPQTASQKTIEKNFETYSGTLQQTRKEIGKVIFGQDAVIDQTLITLISDGHLLLIGLPGLAKTLLVETTAKALGLDSRRIQCTPDLMPGDVIGAEVLEESTDGKRAFRFIEGPVFTNFLMVDEINRASPRTQSALLQAMQEYEISVSGRTHSLPRPFHVLATQNPIEQEGTYPLPEAQLDRFLMQVDVDYPSLEAEREIILATTCGEAQKIKPVMKDKDLIAIQGFVRDMPIGEQVVDAILKLVRAARPGNTASKKVNEYVSWPPGPRASQAMMLAARARALLDGRAGCSIDDVVALAPAIMKHRMALTYKAAADGLKVEALIEELALDL